MNTQTELSAAEKAERNAQYDSARAKKIAQSKVIGKSMQSPIPFGIMDILYYDKVTGKTVAHSGQNSPDGVVLVMLPLRTTLDLTRYAIYSQPADWTLKFHKGQQVYPITNAAGYIQKLIPATKMGSTNAFVDPATIGKVNEEKVSSEEAVASFESESKAPESTVKQDGPAGSGFEAEDERPF